MNIGLHLENPSTTAGSIKIAFRLHKSYVPVVANKSLSVTVAYKLYFVGVITLKSNISFKKFI